MQLRIRKWRRDSRLTTLHSSGAAGQRLLSAVLLLAGAACAGTWPVIMESNYLTYEHPFTNSAAGSVRRHAEMLCSQRKQVAVRTSGTCTLTQCVTSYQCMDQADAATRPAQ